MSLRAVLQKILFTVLIPLSISSALWLYLYPVLQGCAFPLPVVTKVNDGTREGSWLSNSVINTLYQHAADWNLTSNGGEGISIEPAIFRLLVLADPQIEGDSSLPSPEDEFIPRLRRHWANVQSALSTPDATAILKDAVRTILVEDIPSAFRAARKRLDLLGNDYYLAHIYRTLSRWSRPTHVTVLGDLIGSQWVTDEEFENRGWRFWNRVFRGGQRVDDDIRATGGKPHGEGSQQEELEILQRYNSSWANRIINVAGNHDIGYAGDVSEARLERFERVFGPANWDVRFAHPPLEDESDARPTLHIINLNDLTLDGPPLDPSIQSDSYTYVNDLLTHRSYPVEDQTSFTLLLTHVPLHKRDGICVDGPYFTFFDEDDTPDNDDPVRWRKDGLREQNHLSEHVSSNAILQGIFGMSGETSAPVAGMGRRGLILTGHDHEGCDVVHFVRRDQHDTQSSESEEENEERKPWQWDARRYSPSSSATESNDPSIREVTLRSMMGEYAGNAALLSLWFDANPEVNQWRYEIQMCPAGVQHIWWVVHGLAVVCVIGLGVVVGLKGLEGLGIMAKPVKRHGASTDAKRR
ncbi:hypothetical protein EYB26_008082 [Talaromyces marneffei]|uniref:uncharacterized protein n=1 Tax=Talaromyces marneffei TaxID=37727 RepID=UPI0012AAA26D|nr:uncharacterized protein EYB26_008082 [Talaromyces marneffei]QGA20380.1 hypothetical protein EYB26_008082 [Talaromyces marneffei]